MAIILMKTAGDRVREFRKSRRLTQVQFAEALGVSRSYVLLIETGRSKPSREFLIKLNSVYRASSDWVLTGEGTEIVGTLDYPGAGGRYVQEFQLDREEVETPQEEELPVPGGFRGDVALLSGQIAAGVPIVAEENFQEFLHLGRFFTGGVALEVCGDSMIEAGIADGDVVIIKPTSEVRSGTVAALVIDNEATVKRLWDRGEEWEVEAANREFPPYSIRKDAGRLRVAGKVIGLLRKYRQ